MPEQMHATMNAQSPLLHRMVSLNIGTKRFKGEIIEVYDKPEDIGTIVKVRWNCSGFTNLQFLSYLELID